MEICICKEDLYLACKEEDLVIFGHL